MVVIHRNTGRDLLTSLHARYDHIWPCKYPTPSDERQQVEQDADTGRVFYTPDVCVAIRYNVYMPVIPVKHVFK
jgi:hypothetical protein